VKEAQIKLRMSQIVAIRDALKVANGVHIERQEWDRSDEVDALFDKLQDVSEEQHFSPSDLAAMRTALEAVRKAADGELDPDEAEMLSWGLEVLLDALATDHTDEKGRKCRTIT
jgi:uncharacterized protein YfkK (UPF0435 family)